MIRWDEAIFVGAFIVLAMLASLGVAELLAQALQPVSDMLMQGTKDVTQVIVGGWRN